MNSKSKKGKSPSDDPRFLAAVDMIRRTGAIEFQIRYQDDEKPIIWMAAGRWGITWDCAAGMDPLTAVFRLCDQVIDGGTCARCKRPTGFEESIDPMPLDELICWYQWDPELRTFRSSCSGDTEPS